MAEEKKRVGAGFGVMLVQDGKVLLGHRHEDPEKADSALSGAGTWTMPGGKLEFGETFEQGAIRELKEETGIDANNVEVVCINNERMPEAHFITIGLYCDDFRGRAAVLEPDEITEWKWFDLDDLPSPMYFPSTEVIDNYKNKKFYMPEHNDINRHG
jgi:8-oxo-dGTP diphosphatase